MPEPEQQNSISSQNINIYCRLSRSCSQRRRRSHRRHPRAALKEQEEHLWAHIQGQDRRGQEWRNSCDTFTFWKVIEVIAVIFKNLKCKRAGDQKAVLHIFLKNYFGLVKVLFSTRMNLYISWLRWQRRGQLRGRADGDGGYEGG